jgi:hypothetical protein
MLTTALTRWFLSSPEPSRYAEVHYLHDGLDLAAEIAAKNPSHYAARRCRRGHLVSGANAYTRSNGRVECKACRALASRRYRAKARH